MLHDDIKSQIKEAMLAKDSVRLEVLRGLSSAFTNELVAKGKTPQDKLTDEEAIAVISRTAKQRKDAISQFEGAGRQDLADEDKAQLAILEKFLPEMMSEDEVAKIVTAKRDSMGITDPTKKGMLMAEVMKELKGKADGMVVKKVVDSLFN
jgi:uncharacterized protein YqeY